MQSIDHGINVDPLGNAITESNQQAGIYSANNITTCSSNEANGDSVPNVSCAPTYLPPLKIRLPKSMLTSNTYSKLMIQSTF